MSGVFGSGCSRVSSADSRRQLLQSLFRWTAWMWGLFHTITLQEAEVNPFCVQQAIQTGFAIREVGLKPFLRSRVCGRIRHVGFNLRIREVAWCLIHCCRCLHP
jgi:hypothetical protein